MEKNTKSELTDLILSQVRKANNQQLKEIKTIVNQAYTQLESLSWLQRSLKIKGPLPPLRGWPVSPDFLLRLHTWIIDNQPGVVVETGSGATTLVIADALRQNGFGKLYSFEHLQKYADQTLKTLTDQKLTSWVELRVGALEPWKKEHLNQQQDEQQPQWYPLHLDGIEQVELLIVDGPPQSICQYARYPALPALFDRLAHRVEIWMDDANRKDEQTICKSWAESYDLEFEFFPLEKGLVVLTRN